jgi:glycerol-3-phosphate acyltransferase PlsY
MAGTWLLTILLSGYSSLGAIVSALIAVLRLVVQTAVHFPVSMLSCLILLRHHDNIQRLWRRQESKIWTRSKRRKNAGAEIISGAHAAAAGRMTGISFSYDRDNSRRSILIAAVLS